MLQAKIPRICVWQGVERYRPGGCRRNHSVLFTMNYMARVGGHEGCTHIGPMRDLLLAVLKEEMIRNEGNRAEWRRLEALHEALSYRRSVDLGYNVTFWRIATLSLGPDKTAKMARILQVLH